MTSILKEIIAKKKEEVVTHKEQSFSTSESMKQRRFQANLIDKKEIAIIAEIKRASPSKGDIKMTVDPVSQAKMYERAGADAISVLTDEAFFKGSIEDLKAVRKAVNLPLLCKDFIIDPVQIDRAKEAGANIILLIVAALTTDELTSLYHYCLQQDLEVLVEVHDEQELTTALQLGATLIGINNRDLNTFTVDLAVSEQLSNLVHSKDITVISESGIKTRLDVERLTNSNVGGILVGETLMKSENIDETMQQLKVMKRGERV
ncbi:indole-3-glycerol phosphate synthase TrpC [Bacillus spongiae]|uniref:Indole-3-glycerol phosphate synthase n=1 Tax=Bacillus spongiae TaxID=2683610 RepID=A0ABU8HH91_9BACI